MANTQITNNTVGCGTNCCASRVKNDCTFTSTQPFAQQNAPQNNNKQSIFLSKSPEYGTFQNTNEYGLTTYVKEDSDGTSTETILDSNGDVVNSKRTTKNAADGSTTEEFCTKDGVVTHTKRTLQNGDTITEDEYRYIHTQQLDNAELETSFWNSGTWNKSTQRYANGDFLVVGHNNEGRTITTTSSFEPNGSRTVTICDDMGKVIYTNK